MRDDARFDLAAVIAWCRDHLPRHHIPRYWKVVTDFERTPSQRIRKDQLDRTVDTAFDAGDRI